MALKDWKVNRRGVSWEEKKPRRKGFDNRGNKFGRLAVYVFRAPNGWVVRNTRTFTNPIISPPFKTKKESIKFAKSYMRTH